jgi:hypothetical protein
MEPLAKVTFPLDPDESGGVRSEGIWAEPLGDARYRLRNVPFYARGVSLGDTVLAQDHDGTVMVEKILKRGGHSTYRIFLCDGLKIDSDAFGIAWKEIRTLGCTYENANGRWIAVDVPPETDADSVYTLLNRGEADGVWTFEEGHCGHPAQ